MRPRRTFGNVIQVHRDGRIEYDLRDVPDALRPVHRRRWRVPSAASDEADASTLRARELLNIERTFCHDAVIATVLHLQRSLGPHILQVEYIWMTRLLPLVRGQSVQGDRHASTCFRASSRRCGCSGSATSIVEPREEAERAPPRRSHHRDPGRRAGRNCSGWRRQFRSSPPVSISMSTDDRGRRLPSRTHSLRRFRQSAELQGPERFRAPGMAAHPPACAGCRTCRGRRRVQGDGRP